MSNFDRFVTENPKHPLVVRLVRLGNRMSMNGNFAKVYGEVCKLADVAYA